MTNQQLNQLSVILSALTNPIRLRIVLLLQTGELPVNQIRQHLGVERTHLSHMLAKLTMVGLLQTRRAGKQLFYSVTDSVYINPDLVNQLSHCALAEAPTKSM